MNKKLTVTLLVIFVLAAGLGFAQTRPSPKKIFTESKPVLENISKGPASFMENLQKREYKGGQIEIEKTLSENDRYGKYLISYPSDGLKIYGTMNVPTAGLPSGGFPVVILNHGYFNSASFNSGDGTDTMANILASEGYLTLAPDYRGFGNSEDVKGQVSRGHRPEYATDVLNLIASVKSLSKADTGKIALWGHSMGGEVALRVAEATDRLKRFCVGAPTSANAADNAAFYGRRRTTPVDGGDDMEFDGASPINYLSAIQAPISLHQGLADTEVNPEWSKELNNLLKNEDKTIEYFEYPGQDHNFKNLGWDVISERTINFLDRYLK